MSAAPAAPATASRGRRIAARTLLVLGVLLTVVSILSTYVKREALDKGQFESTAQQLIADPAIQQEVAAQMVDALYANVDIAAELQQKLPPNLQALAAPIAGLTREVAERTAQELLTRPRVQASFVTLASASQSQLVKVLRGDTQAVSTTNGKVVLDLQPLVVKLGDRFGLVANLSDRIPEGSAQVTIIDSDQLSTAQDVTHWLEQIANFVWILALACWVGAIWLARGRRRQEVRSLGIGLILVGVLVLLARYLAGKYVVDQVVVNDSVRPAASSAWDILTDSLGAAGWVVLIGGALTVAGAWLVGPSERPTEARARLAPIMNSWEVAWGTFVVLMALIVWALPIQVFRTTVILVVLGAIGFFVLRRQVLAETAAEAPEPVEAPPPAPPDPV
jgi:hypothetical protein